MDTTLQHHGILGQKWGVRRFQNKDGTLTRAGKKRAAKLEAEYEKTTGKKLILEDSNNSKKKALSDLSDEELTTLINRKQLEQNYLSYIKQPETQTNIQKARKWMADKVLLPAAENIGRQTATYLFGKTVNKYLGSENQLTKQIGIDKQAINPKKGQKDK